MLATRARVGILIGLAAGGVATTLALHRETAPPPPARVHALTADDVMEASLQAQGGRARMARFHALECTGTVHSGVDGEIARTEIREAAGVMHFVVHWKNGDYRADTEAGVATEDVGPEHHVMTGDELAQTLLDARFAYDPEWKRPFASANLTGVVDYHGERAYEIHLVTASGLGRVHYVSVDTLLPLGDERPATLERYSWEPAGPAHEETVGIRYYDFREVEGVLMPFSFRWNQSDDQVLPAMEMTYDNCRAVDSALR